MQLCCISGSFDGGTWSIVDLPAEEEEEQKADDNDCENYPSHPRVPCGLTVASLYTIAIIVTSCLRHSVSKLC